MSGSDDVYAGARDVRDQHLADHDGSLCLSRVDRLHHRADLILGDIVLRFARDAILLAADYLDGRGDDAGRVGDLFFGLGLAARTGIAADIPDLIAVHLDGQQTAHRAVDTGEFLDFHYCSFHCRGGSLRSCPNL